MRHRLVVIAALWSAGFLQAAAQAELIGNTFTDSTLYTVSTATGAATAPRATGLVNLTGITTRHSDNTVFALTNAGSLYRLNSATGTTTLVGATGSAFIEADIAYDAASGFLYGIQEFTRGNYGVIQINPATAASTLVGSMAGVDDVSAAAFASNGTLFALDTGVSGNSRLLTLSKTTGQVLSSLTMNVNLGSGAGLTFDPTTGLGYVADGEVGGTNTLYSLNTATGALTSIGATGLANGLAGLTFVNVPEPTTLAAGAAAAVLVRRRRRKC